VVGLLFFVGSFGEEPGWRGFALPKLQSKRTPWKAILILTLFWWIWHLPFYWTLPSAMEAVQQFGFLGAFGIQFFILIALGILCAWVYNGSGGSVLMPVLLHASWNFWLIGFVGQQVSALALPLFMATAIVVVFASQGKQRWRFAAGGLSNFLFRAFNGQGHVLSIFEEGRAPLVG
jgi:membrane protease YdiL (CAAX protease family)